MSKFLDPTNDYAFKRIFGTEKNKDILIGLLNSVLSKKLNFPIREVTLLKTILSPDLLEGKESIVDVLCKDEQGATYIIEMQVAKAQGFKKRAQYYAAKAYTSQLKRGEKYTHLKAVIFLAFTEFEAFPENPAYKSEHDIRCRETGINHFDKISFILVELPKFAEYLKEKKIPIKKMSDEEKFYYFLHSAGDTTPKELREITKNSPIIKRAYTEVEEFYWTEEEIAIYEQQEKRARDFVATIDQARDEGMEKGIEKGKKEMILNLHKAGAPISFMIKGSGLSEEEIDEILSDLKD